LAELTVYGKEFLNSRFRKLLDAKGTEMRKSRREGCNRKYTISRFPDRLPRAMELPLGASDVGLCEVPYPKHESGTELQPVFVYC